MTKCNITVSIIGCTGVPSKYGGFETLAEQLGFYLYNHVNINIFASAKEYTQQEREREWKYGNRLFLPFKANGISSIFYDLAGLAKGIKFSDVILILGGSSGLFLPLVRLFNRKITYIFHPDGVEWKRKKWNLFSKVFLYLSIKTACQFADKIILDNKALIKYYNKYIRKIEIIEYGGNQYQLHKKNNLSYKKYWLTIARAEPENNLSLIGDAFRQLKNCRWILITNWNKTKYGKQLFKKYGKTPNIIITKAIYDNQIVSDYLSNCIGYIHGHSTGGTNPSLVSAMWLRKPLICHDNVFNRETTQDLCYYFPDINKLVSILNDTDIDVNENIIKLAKEKYNWETISDKYLKLFCSNKIC